MATQLVDLAIDLATMDVIRLGGDVVVVSGIAEKAQQVAIVLRTFLGEAIWDPRKGWLTFRGIPFGKGASQVQIEAAAVAAILSIDGILTTPPPTVAITVAGRRASMSYTATTDDGVVSGSVVG